MKRDKHCFDVTEEGLEMDGAFVAPFYPVLREKRLIHTQSPPKIRKEYDIYVKLADGSELGTHTFTSINNIKYSEYWDECCDAELTSAARKGLQIFLQHIVMQQEYVVCYEVERLGLYTVEPVIFVYGYRKAIVPDGINILFSSRVPVVSDEGKQGNIQELLHYAKRLITLRPGITDILFCVRILGVLRPLLEETGYPADFFVGLFGASGTQKSTYAKLFFVEDNAQFLSFSSYNGKQILKRVEQYSGHFVVVDDYHPLAKSYDREKQQSALDAIARNADSGQGAMVVITGEFMEGCFSLQDRTLQIRVSKSNKADGCMLSTQLQQLQCQKDMLGSLIYEFAKKVYGNFYRMKEQVKTLFLQQGNDIYTFRIERNIKFLVVAMQLFEICFPEISAWGVEEQLKTSLRNVLGHQKKHMDIVRRLEYDKDWTREVYLMLSSSGCKKQYEFSRDISDMNEIILEGDHYYITEMVLEREMKKFLECPVKAGEISEHLSKTQVLDEDKSTARTKKKNNIRYYVISRSRLKLYYLDTVSRDK